MDPLSQAVVGATLTQSLAHAFGPKRRAQLLAGITGALAGMAADIDVLFRSNTDPMLFLEFHRQFTHSLIFIPVGGLICAALLYPFMRRWLGFKAVLLFSVLGYATHGLLDTCTSYGTQLFWPFSNRRVAWDVISIIDPLFTLPILVLIVTAMVKNYSGYAKAGLLYGLLYLALGSFQHQRALATLAELSTQRGHEPERIAAKPSFGNILLWKLLYEADGQYFVDAVRLGAKKRLFAGTSINKLRPEQVNEFSPIQRQDVERFRWFSDGYLALSPSDPSLVADVRYSLLPNSFEPLWGIRARPDQVGAHVDYVATRQIDDAKLDRFKAMLFNQR